jgi:GDP-L-fucose synthase
MANDQQVVVWGAVTPMREFLNVDDMADACLFVLGLERAKYDYETKIMLSHINVGTGIDVAIREMAETMNAVVGFEGELIFDSSKPDGAPRKLIDEIPLSKMGWKWKAGLTEGLHYDL